MSLFLILFGVLGLLLLTGAGLRKGGHILSHLLDELSLPSEPYYGDLRKKKFVWNWGTAVLFVILLFLFIGLLAYLSH